MNKMPLATLDRRSVLACGAALALPGLARAQARFPERAITLLVPFGPGGIADLTARAVAEVMTQRLGQPVVVDNRPSAGSIVASQAVASAKPDGHTLLLMSNGNAVSVGLFKKLPYDTQKGFAAISTLGYFDLGLFVAAGSRFTSLRDVLTFAKASPGKLNVGTIAVGSTQNLGAELFKAQAGVQFQIVPYRTTPDVIVALLRNDVALMIDFFAPMRATLLEKKIRPVGTSGPRRSPFLADTPTVGEAVQGYEVTSWNGLFAPAGTPAEVIALLNKSIGEIVAIPDVKQRYADLGIEARASTPEQLQTRLEADIKKWGALIDRAGIQRL